MLIEAQQYIDESALWTIEVHAAPHHAVRIELLQHIPERSVSWQCPDSVCFIGRQMTEFDALWILDRCSETETAVTIVRHNADWEPVDSLTVWGNEW